MIKNLLLSLALVSSSISFAVADINFQPSSNDKLAVEYTLESTNSDTDQKFFDFTKKPLAKIGFFVNDAHHNVNNVYEQQVGETSLEQLSFSSLINDNKARPLFNIDPRLGGFTPFNLVIYRKKDDGKTVITHIMPEAALDILQISNPDVRKSFVEMFKPLDSAIETTFKTTKSYTKLHGYAKDSMMTFELPFEEPDDIDDFFDEFQEEFESAFETKGYIIAGFYNMKYSLNTEADVLSDFDQYVVWSLCHIPFSYTIFDGENPLPKAAMFAPCSMYVYINKGENKMHIGMPTLGAWAAALNITDEKKLAKINQLDTEIPAIIESLGGIKTY